MSYIQLITALQPYGIVVQQLHKKQVKNITLRLKTDGLHITAPNHLSDNVINTYALSHIDWIIKSYTKLTCSPSNTTLWGNAHKNLLPVPKKFLYIALSLPNTFLFYNKNGNPSLAKSQVRFVLKKCTPVLALATAVMLVFGCLFIYLLIQKYALTTFLYMSCAICIMQLQAILCP